MPASFSRGRKIHSALSIFLPPSSRCHVTGAARRRLRRSEAESRCCPRKVRKGSWWMEKNVVCMRRKSAEWISSLGLKLGGLS